MDYRNFRERLLVGVGVGALVLATGSGVAFAGAYEADADADAPEAASATVTAKAEEEEGPNRGNISLTFQNDFTTHYYFRGILQENDGLIWQPSLSVAWKVYSADRGVLQGVSLGIGTWQSVHEEKTLAAGNGPDVWYEADVYPSLTLAWGGGITTGATYYFYTSPNGAFSTVEELNLTLAFDDSPYLDAFALHPSLTFVIETKGTSFQDFLGINGRGHDRGSLAVLAIAPSFGTSFLSNDYPLTFTFPVTLTLSLDDYYKHADSNDTFGFATVGANVNIPLAFIPAEYGSWSVTNGINVFFLNDALEQVNADAVPANDWVEPVWTSSIIMTY